MLSEFLQNPLIALVIMVKATRYTVLVIGIVMSLYGGLNDIEPVTIIGVLLAVIAVMYNLILKAFKK
jgi:hypothetical protein